MKGKAMWINDKELADIKNRLSTIEYARGWREPDIEKRIGEIKSTLDALLKALKMQSRVVPYEPSYIVVEPILKFD